MSELNRKAIAGLLFLLAVMAALLFVTAGTLDYWQAWAFLAAFFAPSFAITLYLMKNDTKLLARRLKGGPAAEKEKNQKIVQLITAISFIAGLVVPALDRRLAWSAVPALAVVLGDVAVIFGFFIVFLVYKENSFTSAIIEIGEGQTVVSTGPYAIVRHPMYAGSFFMLAGLPIALGSWWGLLATAAMLPALIWRLFDEEEFLAKGLPGYADYRDKVRYRLIPFVW